jgi:hypothetical protein
MTYRDQSRSPPLQIRAEGIRYLREQSGKPERMLKARLSQVLRRQPEVRSAYLAQVELGEETSVALCLRGSPQADLLAEIEATFALIFSSKQHLDILFLTESQEMEVRAVCPPFFESEQRAIDNLDTGASDS